MTTLGDRLQAFRKQKSLTQSDFADKIGINRVTLSQIERGATTSNEVIERICTTFEISKDWLLSGKGIPPMGVIIPSDGTENPWRDALVIQLKGEIEFLRELLRNRPNGNFLKPLSYAGLSFTLPEVQTGRQLRGHLRKVA